MEPEVVNTERKAYLDLGRKLRGQIEKVIDYWGSQLAAAIQESNLEILTAGTEEGKQPVDVEARITLCQKNIFTLSQTLRKIQEVSQNACCDKGSETAIDQATKHLMPNMQFFIAPQIAIPRIPSATDQKKLLEMEVIGLEKVA